VELKLKERLVGAAVIIALGVVIIPMLLDGAGEPQLRKIPKEIEPGQVSQPGLVNEKPIETHERPAHIVIDLPDKTEQPGKQSTAGNGKPALKQDQPDTGSNTRSAAAPKPVEPQPAQAQAAAPEPKANKPKPKPRPKSEPKPEPAPVSSWVVQVGSFTEQDKAMSQRDQLRKDGYKAFVEDVRGRSGQPLYRVRVGPLTTEQSADSMLVKLKQSGLKDAFVTRHP
jgi:DedD protein